MRALARCPNCESGDQYRCVRPVSAGGGHAPNFLPGLGSLFRSARFEIVVCRECGLTRWFASEEARRRLSESKRWKRA